MKQTALVAALLTFLPATLVQAGEEDVRAYCERARECDEFAGEVEICLKEQLGVTEDVNDSRTVAFYQCLTQSSCDDLKSFDAYSKCEQAASSVPMSSEAYRPAAEKFCGKFQACAIDKGEAVQACQDGFLEQVSTNEGFRFLAVDYADCYYEATCDELRQEAFPRACQIRFNEIRQKLQELNTNAANASQMSASLHQAVMNIIENIHPEGPQWEYRKVDD